MNENVFTFHYFDQLGSNNIPLDCCFEDKVESVLECFRLESRLESQKHVSSEKALFVFVLYYETG